MPLTDVGTVRSPGWWLLRLGRRLKQRRKLLESYDRYYTGEHILPRGSQVDPNTAALFRQFQEKARTNFCSVPVTATVNRQVVMGVTDGEGKADTAAWSWWQINRLDSRQKQLYRLICSSGWGYVMVGSHPTEARRPLITIEHPDQVITEEDPATRETAAALKAWWDDIEDVGRATVYIGDRLFRFETGRTRKANTVSPRSRELPWGESNWTPAGDRSHGLPRPPVVSFERLADLGKDPVPDFWAMHDIQDRLNLSILNRMTNERYSSNPQAWATGTVVKKIVDPMTGLEVPENPYTRGSAQNVWVNENAEGRFGSIPASDPLGFLKTHEFDIRTAFVLTATPAYYMPADLVNVSTDTIIALENNHVAKVNELNAEIGEGLEDVLALAALVAGDTRDFSSHEVRWRDPRQFNPAVVADMGVKLHSIGYPAAMVAERMGESPQQVDRLRAEVAAEQFAALLTQPAGASTQGQPVLASTTNGAAA